MNRTNFLTSLLAIVCITILATSCRKETDKTVFTCTMPSYNGTKDYILDSIIFWNDGDAVRINDGVYTVSLDDAAHHYKATINADGVTAYSGNYYAAYPANISSIATNGQVTFTLPQEEVYTTSGGRQMIHNIMVAKADGENVLAFQNICALMHFKVNASGSGIGAKLYAIEVESDKPLYGTMTASYDSRWKVTSTSGSGTKRTLRFDTPVNLSSSEQNFYLLVPPVSGGSTFTLRLTVEDTSGAVKVFEKTKASTITFDTGYLYHFTESNTYDGTNMNYGSNPVSANIMDGSEDYPYLVYSTNSWNHLMTSAIMGKAGKHIQLDRNIEVSSTFSAYNFKATLDGKGHTITLTTKNISLLSTVEGGTVKNVTIEATNDVTSPVLTVNGSTRYFGALAGRVLEGSTFYNCINNVNIHCDTSITTYIGGLLGYATESTINNCINNGNITSNSLHIGGIIGYSVNTTSFCNCINNGNIIVSTANATVYTQDCGGIAGSYKTTNDNAVLNCHNYGTITISCPAETTSYYGGIFGIIQANISNCSNVGTITCSTTVNKVKYIGGLIGGHNLTLPLRTMINCYNEGNINAVDGVQSMYCGGLIADIKQLDIKNSYAFCNIKGNTLGGIVATGANLYRTDSIVNCYFYGTLTTTSSAKYGIAGNGKNASYHYLIRHCYSPNNYSLTGLYNTCGDTARLSSAVAISGGDDNSLQSTLNAHIPTGGYSWKNATNNTHVIFDN